MPALGFAAMSSGVALKPFRFDRRALRDDDVDIEILYCGVCHTDLHMCRNDWGMTVYPCVPGHEIVGRVAAIGPAVTRFAAGDVVAIGTIVDSCGHCDQCKADEEQMCREYPTLTYNGKDRQSGDNTYGGYSDRIVVREAFVVSVPKGLDPARVGPLLCAGITTYSPLKTWNVGPGSRVAVIGLGGLGHLGVKFAVGLGADVTVVSRTGAKAADARALGAHHYLVSGDQAAMTAAASSFDLILDTIPARHDVSPYMALLDIDATLVIVGQLGPIEEQSTLPFITGRRRLTGSPSGGIAETQEMLNFCAEKNIHPECETIAIQAIGEAFARLERADIRYRFVIDMASLKSESV